MDHRRVKLFPGSSSSLIHVIYRNLFVSGSKGGAVVRALASPKVAQVQIPASTPYVD